MTSLRNAISRLIVLLAILLWALGARAEHLYAAFAGSGGHVDRAARGAADSERHGRVRQSRGLRHRRFGHAFRTRQLHAERLGSDRVHCQGPSVRQRHSGTDRGYRRERVRDRILSPECRDWAIF